PDLYTLSLHDALPIYLAHAGRALERAGQAAADRVAHLHGIGHQAVVLDRGDGLERRRAGQRVAAEGRAVVAGTEQALGQPRGQRSEEHTSELQSRENL